MNEWYAKQSGWVKNQEQEPSLGSPRCWRLVGFAIGLRALSPLWPTVIRKPEEVVTVATVDIPFGYEEVTLLGLSPKVVPLTPQPHLKLQGSEERKLLP